MNNTAASKASQQGVQPPAIDASQFLKDFDDYLMRVQGLALRTRSGYCFWASVAQDGLRAKTLVSPGNCALERNTQAERMWGRGLI